MAKSRARKLADIIVGAGIDIDGNLTFDGGSTSADLTFADNDKANFGDASDLQIFHSGTDSIIKDSGIGGIKIDSNYTAIRSADGSETSAKFLENGAVELYHDNSKKFETLTGGAKVTGQLTATSDFVVADSGGTARGYLFGTSGGLFLRYNSGSNLQIQEAGSTRITVATGGATTFAANVTAPNLIATTATYSPIVYGGSSNLQLKSNTSEMFAQFTNNGAAELYYDNSKKLETTSTGISVTGDVDIPDGNYLDLGSGGLTLRTNANNAYITESTSGKLAIQGQNIELSNTAGTETFAYFAADGAATLYYDNSAKLATFSGGVSVTGQLNATTMHLPDGSTGLQLGASNDTKFFHDGSNSKITHSGSGGFYIGADTLGLQTGAHNENYLTAAANGAVSLYYDNSAKFATTSTGVDITGTANASTYAATGDSDTYFNFPAANQLSLVGGGAEIVRAYQLAGAYGILRVNGSGSATYPNFTFNGDENTGMYRAGTDTLAFATGGSERVRIDSSGHLLVATTNPSNTVAGFRAYSGGNVGIAIAGQCAELNRLSSDGSILGFQKDGTTVGSIANDSTSLVVTSASTGLKFGSAAIWPTTGGGVTNSNAAKDLGASTAKFKDFYLNGYAYVGALKTNASIESVSNLTFWVANLGEAARIEQGTGNIGVGTSAPSFSAVNSVSSGIKGIEIFKNGTDTASALKLAGDNGSGTKAFAQVGYSGANATAHFANYNTSGTKVGEIVIGSTGNIGIGTTSPERALHVVGGIHLPNNNIISWDQANGTLRNAMYVDSGDDMIIGDTNFDDIYFSTGQKTKTVVIKQTTGRVGVGTSAPSSLVHASLGNQALGFDAGFFASANPSDYTVGRGAGITMQNADVYVGGIYGVRHTNSWEGALAFFTHTSSSGNTFGSTFTEKMRIDSAGNVGIGTGNTIRAPLQVHNSSTGAGSTEFRISRSVDSSAVNRKIAIIMGTDAANLGSTWKIESESSIGYNDSANLNFIHNAGGSPSTRVTFKANGNVGIGNTNPASPFDVYNNGGTYAALFYQTSSDTAKYNAIRIQGAMTGVTGYYGIGGSTTSNTSFRDSFVVGTQTAHSFNLATSDTARVTIDSSGNVGIGNSSPTNYGSTYNILHIGDANTRGLLKLGTGASVNGPELYSSANGKLHINTDSNTNVINLVNNNVGIGTTSPSRKLHVQSAGSAPCALFGNSAHNNSIELTRITSAASYIALQAYSSTGGLVGGPTLTFSTANSGGGSVVERMRIDSGGAIRLGGSTTNSAVVISSCTSTSSSGGAGTGNYLELEAMEPNNPNYGAKKLRLGVQGGGYVKMTMPGAAGLFIESPYQTADKIHVGYAGVQLDMNGGGFGGNQNMLIRCANDITFHPGGSERWRMIAPTGSTPSAFVTNQTTVTNIGGTPPDLNSLELGPGYINLNRDDTVSATQIQFGKNGSVAGSIVTTSSTTYNTTSDRRAKENIVDAQDAGELIDSIRVREFDWKNSGEHQRYGMVAQELLEVAPEVVHQPEDEEQMMGVDYSKLVPMLVKEIQSLRARVAELEGE